MAKGLSIPLPPQKTTIKSLTSTVIVPKRLPEGVQELILKQKTELLHPSSTTKETATKPKNFSDTLLTAASGFHNGLIKLGNSLFNLNISSNNTFGGGKSFGGGSGGKFTEESQDYYYTEDIPSLAAQDTRTYAEAFNEAYKRGEGTIFEWRGKKYKAVKAKSKEEYEKNRAKAKSSDAVPVISTTRYYYDKDGNPVKSEELVGIYSSGKKKHTGKLMKLGGKIIEL